jgi:hypothetical protein
MSPFVAFTLALWLVAFVVALRTSRRRAIARVGILLGLHVLFSCAVVPRVGAPLAPALALQAAAFGPYVLPERSSMRSPAFHLLVSVPGAIMVVGSFLALPWALSIAFGHPLPWPWLPYAIAGVGLFDSMRTSEESVDVVLDRSEVRAVERSRPVRHRVARAVEPAPSSRPLRVVQISDPHLGPFMSPARLAAVCARAVARGPDLILLTGDFLTVDSNGDRDALRRALAPLKPASGRTFACFGNHDHEAPGIVREALEAAGVQLLVDEHATVETPAGRVQIVGADFRWTKRAEHLAGLCAAHPREPGALRIVLLHDPGAFRHLPEGEGDLVFSGHTHGGQLGLLRFGLPHTILSALTTIPDHGLWARGRDRLYVHRGTGHYGFPLRLGVPAEASLLEVHRR